MSQVEQGRRKLDRQDQVVRLADILDILAEQLDAIGKGIPQQQITATTLQEADDALFQALLEPAETTVKLSWLVWYANNDMGIVDHLAYLTTKLEHAIVNRRGILLKPAMNLLAYAHEMRGKIAFDQLDFVRANGHF